MRDFTSGDDVQEFLNEADEWVSKPVTAYLVGGTALAVYGLKPRTEDVDLAFSVSEHFDHVRTALLDQGFSVVEEPTMNVENVGSTVLMEHETHGIQVDLFEQQVVGKVWITDTIEARTTEFMTGDNITALLLAPADLFLLKAVSGGDVTANRFGDIHDLARIAQMITDWESVITEIQDQRPFNTGQLEADHLNNRSHPLLSIERAVNQLSGLPTNLHETVNAIATECQTERRTLQVIQDGTTNTDALVSEVTTGVEQLSPSDDEAVQDAIQRLVNKDILTPVGNSVTLAL